MVMMSLSLVAHSKGVDAEYEKNADTDSIIKEIVKVLEARFWAW